MNGNIFRLVSLIVVAAALGSIGFAQERAKLSATADKYVISAKAGGVNYLEGEVLVARKQGRSGLLLTRDQLEIGDRVSTGGDGRVEILLNPGSYLRLGPNSEFEFKTTSLDDLHINIERGSAIFEVFAADEFRVTIDAPNGSVALVDSGVYRVEVQNDGRAAIAVFNGKALIGDEKSGVIKKGRTGTIDPANVAVSKFDRNARGTLDDWSKSRAKELAKMTSSLKNPDVRNSLMSSFNGGHWGLFDSFGLWVFNPFARSFCFLPFGQDWYSPYGYGYGNDVFWYRLPREIYRRTPVGTSGSINPASTVRSNRDRGTADPTPPFKTMGRDREPGPPIFDSSGRGDSPRPGRVPMISPPTRSPGDVPRPVSNPKGKVIDY